MKNKYFLVVLIVVLGFGEVLSAEEVIKKKVAVVDFGVNPKALSIGAEFSEVLSDKEKGILTADLLAGLAKDSSLEVLEKIDSKTSRPVIANFLEKGKLLGADYLVFGNIDLLELQNKKQAITVSDAVFDEFSGRFVVNLRIVDVHTGEVIYADKVTQSEIECLYEGSEATPLSFINTFVGTVVQQLVTRIRETIWPIKISKIYQGYAYLDRGQNSNLQRGTRMGVFIPMRPIRDSQTGEIMSDTEHLIGELKVTEVFSKTTKAQIIKHGMPIESGFICRMLISSENKRCQK